MYSVIVKRYETILKPKLLESVWGEDMLFMIQTDHLLRQASGFRLPASNFETRPKNENQTSKSKKLVTDSAESKFDNLKLNLLKQFFSLPQKQFVYKGVFIDGNHTF